MRYEAEYAYLGSTGLKVSRIALGCGFRGLFEIDEAASVIQKAIDSGINFIDCADMYKLRSGEFAESALAKAIKGKRDKVVITSKYGGEGGGASSLNAQKQVEASLKRIGTDYIDVYFLHAPDGVTPFDDIVEGLDRLQKSGKIRFYGFCNHRAWEAVSMYDYALAHDLSVPAVIQNPYSLLNRSMEDEMIPACRYRNLGIMAYSPIAAGLLSGAFAHGGKAPEKSTWCYEDLYREYLRKVFPGRISMIVDKVYDIAEKYGVCSSSVAVAWILRNKDLTSVIAGADSAGELEAYLEGASLVLDDADWEDLEHLSYGMAEIFSRPDVQKIIKRL